MWHHVVVVIQAKGLRGKAKVSLFVDGKPTGAPQKVREGERRRVERGRGKREGGEGEREGKERGRGRREGGEREREGKEIANAIIIDKCFILMIN